MQAVLQPQTRTFDRVVRHERGCERQAQRGQHIARMVPTEALGLQPVQDRTVDQVKPIGDTADAYQRLVKKWPTSLLAPKAQRKVGLLLERKPNGLLEPRGPCLARRAQAVYAALELQRPDRAGEKHRGGSGLPGKPLGAAAGIDALLLTDLPPEAGKEIRAAAKANGLDVIFLMAPTSSEARIASPTASHLASTSLRTP